MVVRYDSLNRFETPILTLCNPGSVYQSSGGFGQTSGTLSRVVCPLVNTSALEIVFNFNTVSELHFRINLIQGDNPDTSLAFRNAYRAVANRRMIFVEDIGYFIITNVDTGYDGAQDYKDVTAVSLESEIQSKTIPYIQDGTYKFTAADGTGLLDMLMIQLPLWEVDHIDADVAARYRTFADVDTATNCLGFMLDSMQDAYECIFTFDIKTRTINIYDKNNYTKETNIHITKEDAIKSLKINESADDLYTAMTVLGQSDETISSINPLGGNTIYKFDYYLSWMTPELSEKVAEWQEEVKSFEREYYDLNLEYYTRKNTASNIQMDISNLRTQITIYTRARENIEATGGTGNVAAYNEAIRNAGGQDIDISGEISEVKAKIVTRINECNASINEKTAQLNSINERLSQLQNGWDEGSTHHTGFLEIINTVGLVHYFTTEELAELQSYMFEAEYRDEYVIITDDMDYDDKFVQMKQLYARANDQLDKASTPSQQFTVDVENFVFVKEFEKWSSQLETGCVINVELEEYPTITKDGQSIDDYYSDVASLFMTNVTINYEDHNMSMTFGNRLRRFDTKALFDTVLGNINKTANSLTFVKELMAPIKRGDLNIIEETLSTSRNITMGAALAATNQSVVIDESGYSGRTLLPDGSFSPEQIKITGENIVFTTDNWDSSATAIGKIIFPDGTVVYGINANALIGSLIMGQNLVIYDDKGQPLLSVIDDVRANVATAQTIATSVSSDVSRAIGLAESTQSEINSINDAIAENKIGIQVFYQHDEPIVAKSGDIWIDPDTNLLYVCRTDVGTTSDITWKKAQDSDISKLYDNVTKLTSDTNEALSLAKEAQASLSVSSDAIRNEVVKRVKVVSDDLQSYIDTQGTYLQVESQGVRIGDSSRSENYVWIDPDELTIYAANVPVATFTHARTETGDIKANGKIEVESNGKTITLNNGSINADEIKSSLINMNSKWEVSTSGGYSIKWIG